jgi:hypothetical protein
MPRILLDACVPHPLRRQLVGLDVHTAHYAGLDRLKDHELLPAIEGLYDVLVTLDHGLPHQQPTGRCLAIVVLVVSEQTPEAFAALVPRLVEVLGSIGPGEVDSIGMA